MDKRSVVHRDYLPGVGFRLIAVGRIRLQPARRSLPICLRVQEPPSIQDKSLLFGYKLASFFTFHGSIFFSQSFDQVRRGNI